MATRAEVEARLTAFFGSAAAWAYAGTPAPAAEVKGVVPELLTKLEVYRGTGFTISNAGSATTEISQPKSFSVVRHISTNQWGLLAGWNT